MTEEKQRLAQSNGQNLTVSFLFFLTDDGKRAGLRTIGTLARNETIRLIIYRMAQKALGTCLTRRTYIR